MTKDGGRNRPGRHGAKGRGKGPWSGNRGGVRGGGEPRSASFMDGENVWIWGLHAASAAIGNSQRRIIRILATRNAANRAGLNPEALPSHAALIEPSELDDRLPQGAVHQGLAVLCEQLDGLALEDAAMRPDRPLAILDQVTDPQNVGAIFRSAAAFGFGGIVMQTRHAPPLGGALAKAATGAVEIVPEIRVVNIARSIDTLCDAGWHVVGLDGSSTDDLGAAIEGPRPVALVLGAEGAGLRPAVAKACSQLARIPMSGAIESLNVSNAAAIAFYEASRRLQAASDS